MRICRLVNSRRLLASASTYDGVKHSGANRIVRFVRCSARVMEKSSLTEWLHSSGTPICSNTLRLMAVPPPQQKFLPFSLSKVTIEAFHAADSADARLFRKGISQRMVVVAPTRESCNGEIKRRSQARPGD